MELYFLVASPDKMVYNVGGRGIATGAAKPLLTSETTDYAARIVNATVAVIV